MNPQLVLFTFSVRAFVMSPAIEDTAVTTYWRHFTSQHKTRLVDVDQAQVPMFKPKFIVRANAYDARRQIMSRL